MKQLRVTVQGKVYEVTVEILDEGGQAPAPAQSQLSVAPASASPSASTPSATTSVAGPGSVGSPLAGKVVGVQVTVGQAVKTGDQLVILEAMKMNTYVYAPHDGTVAEILTKVGDAVAEGQALLRITA